MGDCKKIKIGHGKLTEFILGNAPKINSLTSLVSALLEDGGVDENSYKEALEEWLYTKDDNNNLIVREKEVKFILMHLGKLQRTISTSSKLTDDVKAKILTESFTNELTKFTPKTPLADVASALMSSIPKEKTSISTETQEEIPNPETVEIPAETEVTNAVTGDVETKTIVNSLEDDVKKVFGNYALLENYRISDFNTAMLYAMQIYQANAGARYMESTSNEQLNIMIQRYKADELEVLINFINSQVPDSEKIVKRDKEGNILYTGEGANKKPITEPLYKEKDETNKGGTVNRELLNKVIKSFESLVELGVVSPNSISEWWENKYFDHQELNNQWHAACAYLTLKHFDESLVASKLDSIVRINIAPGIEIDKFDFGGKPINKYTIGKDKSHLIKNWNIGEYRNAVKENSKLAMLVISSIDKYQYHIGPDKPTPIIGKLSVTEIANAWSHLVASVKLLKAANITRTNNKNFEVWRDDMYKNILKVADDPQFHMKKVLDILFKGTAEGKTDFQDALLSDQGLNYEDYNILYSVWRHEIDTNSTRIKAQNNTLSSNSVKEFLKSDIIYSVIRKNNAVNYLTTIWDPTSGSYKTKYIAKSDQVFRNKMNYLRGKSAELASAIPENLREILAKFDVKRVPTDNNPNKFKPNQLKITLDGKEFRLVLTLANKSLGASDATSYFHIIPVDTDPDLIDKISRLLEADNDENLKNGELKENPYSSRIDSALISILNKVSDTSKTNKEREEAAKVIATALGIYSNTYNKSLEVSPEETKFSKLSLEDKTTIISEEFTKIRNGLYNPYDDALNSKLGTKTIDNILNKNEKTKELNSLMEFMDSFLTGLDLVSEEGLITLNTMMDRSKVSVKSGEESVPRVTLRQVMSEAAMLAYKMTLQAEAGDRDLKDYVASQDPILSAAIGEGKVLRMIKGKPRFNALSNSDWLERFFDAKTMTDGNATRATTKGRDGNAKANYVPASLSDHINEQWEDRRNYIDKNSGTAPLATNLVMTNEQLVVDIARDSSFASMYDEKNTKTATPGELIFHGIVNNFFNAMNTNDGKVAILPTVYSDKTAFINFMVDLNKKVKGIDKTLWQLTAEESEQLYAETVIPYYYKQFRASINKFVKLFEFLQNNPDSNPSENLKNILTTFDAKNATPTSINNILRNINQDLLEELIRAYNTNNKKILEFAVDSDYRKQKGYLSLNEIAADYARMYETEDVDETVRGDMSTRVKASNKLKARFKQEKLKYIKGLLQQNVNFYYDKSSPLYQTVHSTRWTTAAGVTFANFDTDWVHYGNLVLAKDAKTGENIYDINDIPADGNIIMNPLLEKQYYIDTIMSSNIKYATVGDEISDPLKAGLDMQKDFNADSVNSDGTKKSDTDIQELGKLSAEEVDFLQHTDLTTLGMILSGEDNRFPNIRDNKYVKDTYNKLIYRCISTSEGSQYKRNVIIPGSGIYYNLNSLSGIGATTKISYFDDPQSEVFNVAGARSDGEDAQDGSAQENPIMAILENCSLNADAVGYRYKKPIWYIYDDDMGCSRLIKYAVHTIHNDVMRNSNGSTTSMYKLFKKMCNITWDKEYDLLHSCETAKDSDNTLHFIDVVNFCKDDEGNPTGLYYEDINKNVFAITNFKRDSNGHYVTTEVDATNVSKIDEKSSTHKQENTYYVMHVFNENDEDVKIKSYKGEKEEEFLKRAHEEALANNYHNIRSIYQLHQAMGGIYSVKRVDGATNKFVPAESSNYAVAAFLNNVSILKPEYVGKEREEIPATQEAYEQPLKKFMIGYAVLKSASKRHTTNINSVDALNNDKELLYSEVSNKGHCIQQDPTHTADEAELTEMSQVIASLDVGGKLHDIAAEAFKGLGKLIIDKLNLKEKLINAFQKNLSPAERLQVTEKLYDVVVREFLDQYQARSKTDLAASIVAAIKRNFGADALFRDADFKLPISDPNIFRQIVSTFISSVNTALKRKYSGIGDVMTPGFNQFQIYRLKNENGEDMDLLLDDVFSSHAHEAAKSILVNQYNPDTIVKNAKPYKKPTSVGENNAWFLTLEDGFEFNPNAENKEERYRGHHGIEIVQHNDNPYEYEIHFKNDITTPWTKLEKTTYYLALNKFLNLKKIEAGPNKAITVVLTGEVSKGGFSGFNRLHQFGLVPTGKYRPVSLKDTEVRGEVLERWKNTYQDPQAYLNAIEDKDVRENTLKDWNSKLLNKTTNLETDVLAPEFEFKYALLNPVEMQMKALGDNDAQIRQTMLNMYFAQEQEKVDAAGNKVYYKDINEFSPSDNIILDDVNGKPIHLDLSNIDTYFAVKNCLHFHNYTLRNIIDTICLNSNIALNIYLSTPEYRKTLLNKINEALKEDNKELTLADTKALPLETLINLIYSDNLNSRLDVAKPSNLKPQLITFKIKTAEGIKTYNLYDLDYIRSKHHKQGSRKANYDPEVDRVIDKLVKEGKANIGGLEYEVVPNSIDNREAEALMTDIHKSKFKQSSNSLYEQLTNFESKTLKGITSDFADIVLAGKRNLGLTFHDSNAIPVDLDLKVLDEDIVHEDDKILIYAKNRKSQERTYMIGWYDPTDYQVRKKVVGEVTTYYIVDANERIIEQTPDLQIIGGKVYRKEYIVQKLGGFSNTTLRDETIINICPDKLKDYLRKYSEEWKVGESNNDLISETQAKIVKDLAKYNQSTHLQLVQNTHSKNNLIQKVLPMLQEARDSNAKYWNDCIEKNIQYIDALDASDASTINDATIKEQKYLEALQYVHNQFIDEIKASHNLARFFVAARIPAQSLQSYMKMRCVGFLQGTDNQVIVSHFQTWLQGSDYDIDKAYMMSYSFDQNGRFIGWSKMFNYSSPEMLQKSLLLPVPKGYTFDTHSKNGENINEDLAEIAKLKNANSPLYLEKMAKLLIELEKQVDGDGIIHIQPVQQELMWVLGMLRTHEETEMPMELREEAVQNSISARIQQIVQDPRNIQLAYMPITMKELHDIAATSPKGNMVTSLTGMNPVTKYIMQCQNMIGKDVISIAAVGEKIFMGLSFYFNELTRNVKDGDTHINASFRSKTKRIEGRAKGKPTETTKYCIADVNWEDIPEHTRNLAIELYAKVMTDGDKERAREILMSNVNHTDLLISQLLSAATDNAKELILDKINSGKATANIYLHLLIQGYKMEDIAAFMISPAASLISDIMNSSIYNPYRQTLDVGDSIKIAREGYNINEYISKDLLMYMSDEEYNTRAANGEEPDISIQSQVINGLRSLYPELFIFVDDKGKALDGQKWSAALYRSINKDNYKQYRAAIIDYLQKVSFSTAEYWDSKYKKLVWDWYINNEKLALSRSEYLEGQDLIKNVDDLDLDLIELDNIRQAAMETTTLGTLFGLNKEVKPEVSQILQKINSIESTVDAHLKPLAKYIKYIHIVDDRNVDLNSDEYRDARAKLLELEKQTGIPLNDIKKTLNLGEVIIKQGFSFEKFANRTQEAESLKDDRGHLQDSRSYRQLAIDLYELGKSQYNILDVMDKHPQYRSAMETWIVGHQLLCVTSAKASIADSVRKDLKLADSKFEDERQINGLFNYAETLLINSWLRTKDIQFPMLKDQKYISPDYDTRIHEGNNCLVSLKDPSMAASFKLWFEQYFIPQLRRGHVVIPGKKSYDIPADNAFVKALIYGEEHGKPVYRLNLLMDLIDSNPSAARKFQNSVKDLNDLPQELLDFIMLYNILVTHNAPGNDRFANVFSGFVNQNNLLNDYLHYVGEIDFKLKNANLEGQQKYLKEELGYNVKDAKFYTAPTFRDGHLPKKVKSDLIIIQKKNGELEYRKKGEDGSWETFTEYAFYTPDTVKMNDRLYNYSTYGILYTPNSFTQDLLQYKLESRQIKEVRDLLERMINAQKLNIKRVC